MVIKKWGDFEKGPDLSLMPRPFTNALDHEGRETGLGKYIFLLRIKFWYKIVELRLVDLIQ